MKDLCRDGLITLLGWSAFLATAFCHDAVATGGAIARIFKGMKDAAENA